MCLFCNYTFINIFPKEIIKEIYLIKLLNCYILYSILQKHNLYPLKKLYIMILSNNEIIIRYICYIISIYVHIKNKILLLNLLYKKYLIIYLFVLTTIAIFF